MREVQLHWQIRADLDAVVQLDAACNPDDEWDTEQYLKFLRQSDAVAIVARSGPTILGNMVYMLQPHSMQLIRFNVSPECRRQRVGSQMMDFLRKKLGGKRSAVYIDIRETDLAAQLFLRVCGCAAYRIEPEHFADGEDAYQFVLSAHDTLAAPVQQPGACA